MLPVGDDFMVCQVWLSFLRIGLTQVGDALAHHQKCIFHHASMDRLVARVASMVVVAVAKDEEVKNEQNSTRSVILRRLKTCRL